MAVIADVNALVGYFVQDHPHHEIWRSWWQARDREEVLLVDLALVGLVRIVTNSRIYSPPADPTETFEFVEALLAQPNCRRATDTSGALSPFRDLCESSQATGNLVPDAYLAGVARSLGCGVVSLDRDFRRFDGLRIVDPSVRG